MDASASAAWDAAAAAGLDPESLTAPPATITALAALWIMFREYKALHGQHDASSQPAWHGPRMQEAA